MSAGTDVFFERVLLPHRSLPPRGFHLLMLLLGLVSLAVGHRLCGDRRLAGLRVFRPRRRAVYLAFRLSYRSARQREILRLADDEFTVERIDIYGERRVWRFQPFWLRVILLERPDESNRLLLASHGQKPADRRFSRRPDAPRTGRDTALGTVALARRAEPGEQRGVKGG